MDTMQATQAMQKTQGKDAPRDPLARPASRGDWHGITYTAVGMAWTRDPDVMNDLVATLLDIHLHHSVLPPERTLDELHLMVALELQQLSGEDD
ncbi:MAG: hypothetical protein J7507_04550 [Pseudoxanthomonas sp.]|nr:hypothetical protein [Pseudoxanthomonas sp.]